MSLSSILIYGLDSRLLETRQWVFERSGARVVVTTDRADFARIAAVTSIDLIVLCHSLSMEECGRALALAHTLWPQVQSLLMISGAFGSHPGQSERIADAAQGPEHLVHTVEQLLGSEHGIHTHATQTAA